MYLKIGLFQCLAMIPGVSRSGATIVGAMLMGADKRAAAEFSFFLAMPTMAGAFTYELLKSYKTLSFEDGALIAVGFVAAFVSGLIVVKGLLDYVSRHGFSLFAWWRIVVGAAGLAGLLVSRLIGDAVRARDDLFALPGAARDRRRRRSCSPHVLPAAPAPAVALRRRPSATRTGAAPSGPTAASSASAASDGAACSTPGIACVRDAGAVPQEDRRLSLKAAGVFGS